ncbi:hypothetical protein DXG01_004694, partial [Tephrocybe rancida]
MSPVTSFHAETLAPQVNAILDPAVIDMLAAIPHLAAQLLLEDPDTKVILVFLNFVGETPQGSVFKALWNCAFREGLACRTREDGGVVEGKGEEICEAFEEESKGREVRGEVSSEEWFDAEDGMEEESRERIGNQTLKALIDEGLSMTVPTCTWNIGMQTIPTVVASNSQLVPTFVNKKVQATSGSAGLT